MNTKYFNDQTLSLTCYQSTIERSIHECDIDYESSTNSTLLYKPFFSYVVVHEKYYMKTFSWMKDNYLNKHSTHTTLVVEKVKQGVRLMRQSKACNMILISKLFDHLSP